MSDRRLERILHVDDEPDIREIVRLALRLIGGYTVESCSSGRDAIDRVPVFRPDIILLDVMMPGMSGPETLTALREMDSGLEASVVFMTAKSRPDELRSLGGVDVIAKPFDPLIVSDQLSQIWARHAHR